MRDQHVLLWKSVKILNLFNNLTLKQILWKIKAFFKKTGVSFLVESTKIENASFPYKTAISEANVKTNRMVSTKWTYHKERSFASNYFIFSKILFQIMSLLQRVDLMYQRPKCSYYYFLRAPEFYLTGLFPCEYPQVSHIRFSFGYIYGSFQPFP